jgi:hypothetical protein
VSRSWKDPQKRRQFFDNLIKELKIQHPEGWYKIANMQSFIDKEGLSGVVSKYYGGSLMKGTMDICSG